MAKRKEKSMEFMLASPYAFESDTKSRTVRKFMKIQFQLVLHGKSWKILIFPALNFRCSFTSVGKMTFFGIKIAFAVIIELVHM